MPNKIFHIAPDAGFIQFVSRVFEDVAPERNNFLIHGVGSVGELRYPPDHRAQIATLHPDLDGLRRLMPIRDCGMVIAHGMSPYGAAAFLLAPSGAKKVWSGWGYDYYEGPNFKSDHFLMPETRALCGGLPRSHGFSFSSMKWCLWGAIAPVVAHRTNYFSAPIPDDFEIFKANYSAFDGEYTQLNYGDVASSFAIGRVDEAARNILIGNSASPTNNHIEIFRQLSELDLVDSKVIVPLTYGDENYRKMVIERGGKLFGDKFFPLIKHLELDEYISVIASCNVVIMNHLRQQGLGNIGAALYHGAHVYLDPENPIYRFLTARNGRVHTTGELKSKGLPSGRQGEEEIEANRRLLEEFWGVDRVRANVRELIARISASGGR